MDLFKIVNEDLLKVIKDYVGSIYDENERLASNVKFSIPPTQTGSDYSTNVAMVFARVLKKAPNIIAQELSSKIAELDYVKQVSVVNGYINIVFKESLWEDFLAGILAEKDNFGKGDPKGKVLLEFISANPTGPLHVGHCRGAILGLAIDRLMRKAGYDFTKENYINDYGDQIITLLKSVQFRYEQNFGLHKNESMPEGCYTGDFLVDYANSFA